MFVAGSVAVWIAFAILFVSPSQYFASDLPEGMRHELIDVSGASVFLLTVAFVLFVAWLVQEAKRQFCYGLRLAGQAPQTSELVIENLLASDVVSAEGQVNAAFLRDGFVYGRDHGYLRFEGSSVYFEGARTQFSVCRSRLTATAPQSPANSVFYGADPVKRHTRLTYVDKGIEYGLAFSPSRARDPSEAKRDFEALQRWLDRPFERAEYEVLLPRTIPIEAVREAREAFRGPALVLQGILFFEALGLSVYLSDLHDRFLNSGSVPHFTLAPAIIAIEFIWLGTTMGLIPMIRASLRYRFLRGRSQAKVGGDRPSRTM